MRTYTHILSGVNLVLNLGVVDPGQTNFDLFRQFFSGNFTKEFHKKIRFFQGNFRKMSIFSGNLKQKFDFPSKQLSIYSYFWANYSISLQKSPLSNILPAHDKI